MFEEDGQIKVFMVTTKEIINRLEALKDIEVSQLQDSIEDAFDNYNVEGEEELKGQDTWCTYSADGKHELCIGINHEDAYEFTLYIETNDGKASIVNVL